MLLTLLLDYFRRGQTKSRGNWVPCSRAPGNAENRSQWPGLGMFTTDFTTAFHFATDLTTEFRERPEIRKSLALERSGDVCERERERARARE